MKNRKWKEKRGFTLVELIGNSSPGFWGKQEKEKC